jgi:hypothetical protein
MLDVEVLCLMVDGKEEGSFLSCLLGVEAASPSPTTVLELDSWVSVALPFISSCERFLVAGGIVGEAPSGGELGGDGFWSFI